MYEDVKRKLNDIPTQIKEQELKLVGHNRELERINREKKQRERKIYIIICNETIEVEAPAKKGADVSFLVRPKYTNAEMREAEQENRLSIDYDYMKLVEQELTEQQNAKLASIEKDYLERDLKSTIALVKILELEK